MLQSDKQSAMCPECGADIPAGAAKCPDCGVSFGEDDMDGEDTHMRSTLIESSLPDVPGRAIGSRPPGRPSPRRAQQNSPAPRRPPPRPRPTQKSDEAPRRQEPRTNEEPRPGATQRNSEQAHREARPKRPNQRLQRPQRPQRPRQTTAEPAIVRTRPNPKREKAKIPAAEPGPRNTKKKQQKRPQQEQLSSTSQQLDQPSSSLNLVAVELEEGIDGIIRFASDSDLADKITMLSALLALIASFLPWSGRSLGIFAGASPLLFFVVASLSLTFLRRQRLQQADEGMIDEDSNGNDLSSVRLYNLLQIFSGLGALLYLSAVGLGYYYASPKMFNLRFGWFVALFFSAGLAYGGIARFVRDARRLSGKN